MFSEIVDEVLAIAGASDTSSLNASINYAQLTLREIDEMALFEGAGVEVAIPLTSTTADSYTWTKPTRFRDILVAEYYNLGVEPKAQRPGTFEGRDNVYQYYGTPKSLIFNGIRSAAELRLFYFIWSRQFTYYAIGLRPAVYDFKTETWSYLNAVGNYVPSLGNETLEAQAQDLVSNWITINWYTTVVQGTLTKLFNSRGDKRSVTAFSIYRSQREAIMRTERIYRKSTEAP